jgi:hypothetical protein
MPSHEGSKQLQRIKALEGPWTGSTVTHESTVICAVTLGGRAVVETLHPGSPMGMVSVYYDTDDGVAMTHYCALGNQPCLVQSDVEVTTTLARQK